MKISWVPVFQIKAPSLLIMASSKKRGKEQKSRFVPAADKTGQLYAPAGGCFAAAGGAEGEAGEL